MIARKNDAILDYIREQGLGMAAALLTERYIRRVTQLKPWVCLENGSKELLLYIPTYCQYIAGHIPYFFKKMNVFQGY